MTFEIDPSCKQMIETFSSDLRSKINEWFEWDQNPKTRAELIRLIREKNVNKLSSQFLKRQCFGTAGIRGIMETGFNCLNDLTIIQTSQGLAKYLLTIDHKDDSNRSKQKSIIIGYDGRYNSFNFAKLTAKIFMSVGFKVGLFSTIVPTPFVSFATSYYKTDGGIMITASHNPKQYNGYKVFASNGAQILSPHDQNIQESILNNLKPWNNEIWNIDDLPYSEKLFDPLPEILDQYYDRLLKQATQMDLIRNSDLRITYTALHGVGHESLTKVFKYLGLKNYFPVLSQKDPDPEFPTVVFPNPEEGQGVFDESIKTATKNGCSLIFANDPDSDRFCMAELNDNKWRVFNGNEIGALLGWWLWHQFKQSPESKLIKKEDCFMISSAVSSKILETFSKKEGFQFVETLTGFKWMANQAFDLEKQNKKVLFCFEEAIGFMPGTIVLDKDGISTAATVLQLAVYLRSKNQTFLQLLNQIYEQYGFHYSYNSYYLCYDPKLSKKIFEKCINIDGPQKYIQSVNGVKVSRIRDLMNNFDSSSEDLKAKLPESTMLTLYFENGSVITFRTSGTEPKIKFYSEIIADPQEKDWEKIKNEHCNLIKATVERILEPEVNQLVPKSD